MSPPRLILLLSLFTPIFSVSVAGKNPPPPVFLLPVIKDKATSVYYTPVDFGNHHDSGPNQPPLILNLALDLAGSSLLLGCGTVLHTAHLPLHCSSGKCKHIKPDFCFKGTTCGKYVNASFIGRPINARLAQANVSLTYSDNGFSVKDDAMRSSLLLTCTDDSVLKPLSVVASGSIGLAKTLLSLPSQLADAHNIPPKFALCLPSKPGKDSGYGDLYIGGGPYYMPPYAKDASKILASTPLIFNQRTSEYFIDVESIEINGEAIAFDRSILRVDKKGHGGTKICNMAPYNGLHTSIYTALVKGFTARAKMSKAEAVKPFGACFSSKGLKKSMMGPGVPVIDLVVRGGAKWSIHGSNSLVKVKKGVVCLGFVDAGKNNMEASVVIGGRTMEDNLVEFDLKASKLSFSSSLLLHNTSCSHFRLY